MRTLRGMGLKIFVTEMDINDDTWKTDDPAEIDAAVAQTYHDFMDVMVSEPAVTTVVAWGVTDAHTWLAGRRPGPRPPGAGPRPGQAPGQAPAQPAGQAEVLPPPPPGQAEVLPPGPPPGQTVQQHRAPERPLLFDANNKPKASFFTVRDAFDTRTA
jgi:GH35 family endo-1,4-beta-xylanase